MKRTMWRPAVLAVAVCGLLSTSPAAAQDGAPPPDFLHERGPKAKLMLLGSFHFAYPNRDRVKPKDRIDVLEPARQREIEEMVERLAAFRPTKIAVEQRPERQAALDSLYREYLAGRWEPEPNEVYQLGFRLARRLGHDRVYAVDEERNRFFVDLAMEKLAPREEELLRTDAEWRRRFDALRAYEDSIAKLRYRTMSEIFVALNSPEKLRRDHMAYHVGFFKFDGEEGGYAGADFVAGWYDRNLRIFRNIQRITEGTEDRILLIIGSGHLPILRFVAQHSPEYDLVEPNGYLGSGTTGRMR